MATDGCNYELSYSFCVYVLYSDKTLNVNQFQYCISSICKLTYSMELLFWCSVKILIEILGMKTKY